MKKKVVFLKAPSWINKQNKLLTNGKIYRAEHCESNVFGRYYFVKNDSGNRFMLSDMESIYQGWEPIYNTDIAVGVSALVICAGLGLWILSLMS